MQLSDITTYMGISAQHLADLMGVSRQAINNYTRGRKGKPSKFVGDLLVVANLNREEMIFPDRFDHPDGENPEHPAYWMNIAIEAVHEATKRGLSEQEADRIAESIRQAIVPMLDDIGA
jgi:transcriptional regulator with XRE-family HTH domain